MDKNKNKRSMLESSNNTLSGYSIEYSDITFKRTLEERIEAARAASSNAKQVQKQNNKEKLHFTNSRNTALKEDTCVENMTVKKKNTQRQHWSSTSNMPSTITKSINTTSQTFNTCESLPNYKGGLMQRRLEAIKANKKLTKMPLKYDNTTEQTKFLNNQPNVHGNLLKYHVSNQFDINVSKHNEYKSKPTVQNNLHNEIGYCDRTKIISDSINNNTIEPTKCPNNQSSLHETLSKFHGSKCNEYKSKPTVQKNIHSEIGHCDRTKIIANTSKNSETSVQNRLTRAKEEMTAKSKFTNQNNVSKMEINKNEKNKKPSTYTLSNIHQDTNTLVHNIKNKTKRLNQSNQYTKKKIPTIISTTKKIFSNSSDVNQMISKQLITVQKKPVVPKATVNHSISYNPSETVQSTKLENSNQNEAFDSFSFVLPQNCSAQQRLEQIKKKQLNDNDDDSMEWEDIIEPNQIVESVKVLRKTTYEYEPMEWTPDSIIHSDLINHCLVIDTNIFLSNLRSITAIIDQYLPEYGYITIVIPWQVLQELDHIKKKETILGFRAREATRWLLEMLSKKHPRIKGQPMTRKEDGIYADDSILNCAITLKSRVNYLNLITDDKMLSVKSEINGIHAKNSTWLEGLTSVKCLNGSQIFQEAVKNYPIIENKLIMKFGPHIEHFIGRVSMKEYFIELVSEDITPMFFRILKLSVNQNNDYSTFSKKAWWKIYSLIPPLNITKCLLKLKEHWNTIVVHRICKAPQKQLDWLIHFFEDFQQMSYENTLSWNELYNLLKNCTEIINALPYEYYHITDILLNDLIRARKFLNRKLDCITLEDESLSITLINNLNVSNDSASNIDNILLNILKEVDIFCSNVYKSYGCSLNLSKNDANCIIPITLHSNDKVIEAYCHKLSDIIKVMSKIKIMTFEQILASQIIIDSFLTAIVQFDNNLIQLNKESLMNYILMKDKNKFLNILISFQNNLASMKNLITTIKKC